MLFVRLVNLFESGLCGGFGFFHLVLDLIDVLLLLADDMSEVLVNLVDLVHSLVDLSDFILAFLHDFLLKLILLDQDLLLLEGCSRRVIVGAGRSLVLRSGAIHLLVLFHLFLDLGFRVCDICLDLFKVAFQFEKCLFVRTRLRLTIDALALSHDLFLEASLELSQDVRLGLVLLFEFRPVSTAIVREK